jgi:hypothetical protein
METNPIIEYFNRLLPLNEEEKAMVAIVFKERKIKRRQFILPH